MGPGAELAALEIELTTTADGGAAAINVIESEPPGMLTVIETAPLTGGSVTAIA